MYNDSNQNSMESVCGVCANQSHNVVKVILNLHLNSDFNFKILLNEYSSPSTYAIIVFTKNIA